jgi:lysophospholipase L1-like esterase
MMRTVLSAAAVVLVLVAVARGGQENSAVKPEPRQGKGGEPNAGWIKRHVGFVIEAKKGDIDVLFLGDSITDAWRSKGDRGGKEVWDKNFAPLKAANFGIGGDRTQHVLWRIQNGELEGIEPKVAVLMIGTNNLSSNTDAQIEAGIKAIVKTLREKTPKTKVLLLGIFPRNAKADAKDRGRIAAINKEIAKLDDGKNVKYLDIGQKFLAENGELPRDIMWDSLHLTSRGYEIWAEAILPTLRELLK